MLETSHPPAFYLPREDVRMDGFEAIRDHVAFYPAKMEACLVDGERVQPEPGGFYGGWITSAVLV